MGETGKRFRHDRNGNNEGKSQKRRQGQGNSDQFGSGDGELVVYRILCANGAIGGVIGKAGKVINNLRHETNATIKVVDPFPNADKRVITIYCYVNDKEEDVEEGSTEPLCPAQDALLKVHAAIVNASSNARDSDKNNMEEALLLVPSSQAANIIGKSGATIKRLRSTTGANIKVNPKDPSNITHSCAMSFDNFVQIAGDGEAVKRALYAVSAIMYKFSPREEISLDTAVPEQPLTTIIIPSDVPVYPPAGSFYSNADTFVPPSGSLPPVFGSGQHMQDTRGYSDTSNAWPSYPSGLPVISGFGSTRSEELVIKVLCPSDKIGRVIGRGGGTIKNIRQASGARVDVDDKKNNEECIITVTSTESTEDARSAAVETVLLLQEKINEEDEETVNMRLLVPSKVIGFVIGKNGSVINEMRKKTKADIRISKGEKPKCAASDDELVEVIGEVGNLRNALVQVVMKLREDALRDKDGVRTAPAVETVHTSGISVPPALTAIPPMASFDYNYNQRVETGRDLSMLSGSNLYGYNSYQTGDNGYGSLSSYSSHYGGLPSYIEVLIPANSVSRVMGTGGINITNIQKISGARVDIVESKTSRSERIAQISGTHEQKRTAENLIQGFIMATLD